MQAKTLLEELENNGPARRVPYTGNSRRGLRDYRLHLSPETIGFRTSTLI